MTGLCTYEGCSKPHQARGYCATHYRKMRYGKEHLEIIQLHAPKGSGSISNKGYARYGHEETHRLVAAKALGKPLPPGVVVHHLDKDIHNSDARLIICPDQSYHMLIEKRQKAFEACGNPNAVKCRYCQEWGDPIRDDFYVSSGSTHHRACRNKDTWEKR